MGDLGTAPCCRGPAAIGRPEVAVTMTLGAHRDGGAPDASRVGTWPTGVDGLAHDAVEPIPGGG